MAATTGMPCAAISSHAGSSSARNAATTRCVTALGTTLRYVERCSAAKSNSRRMRVACVTAVVGGRRGERHGDCGRDGIVAVAEVLVEDLPADAGAGDDVADRQLVDRTFVASANAASRSRVRTRSARGSTLWARAAMPAA